MVEFAQLSERHHRSASENRADRLGERCRQPQRHPGYRYGTDTAMQMLACDAREVRPAISAAPVVGLDDLTVPPCRAEQARDDLGQVLDIQEGEAGIACRHQQKAFL